MEVGWKVTVTVVDLFFQDASFTVSPVTALSQTVYCSNSDAFRTQHYLFIVALNSKVLESTAV
jgi:hypothetical protein